MMAAHLHTSFSVEAACTGGTVDGVAIGALDFLRPPNSDQLRLTMAPPSRHKKRLVQPFQLGDFYVEPSTRRISRNGQVKTLEPRLMSVLQLLTERAREVVSSEQVTSTVWGPNHVGDSPVAQAISQIRRALGDDAHKPAYIETIPKCGYRLIAEVVLKNSEPVTGLISKRRAFAVAVIALAIGAFGLVSWRQHKVTVPIARSPPQLAQSELLKTKPPTLVVFPFTNLTGDDDNSMLCEGISDEMRYALDELAGLSVVDPYSTQEFQRQDRPLSEIPSVLGADYTLAGSLRLDGSRLRVIARLIHNTRGIELWTDAYDYEMGSLLAMQADIAENTTESIRNYLGASGQPIHEFDKRKVRRNSENFDAYRAYLQGRNLYSKGTQESLFGAVEKYEEALTIDPHYAMAWIGLTNVRRLLLARGFVDKNAGYQLAIRASDEAIRLDDTQVEAWAAACMLRMTEAIDWPAAEPYCNRAIELGPNTMAVRIVAAHHAMISGRLDEAIAFQRRRAELDPLQPNTHAFLGLLLFFNGDLEQAKKSVGFALDQNAEQPMARGLLGQVLLAQGDSSLAETQLLQESVRIARLQGLSMLYHSAGDADKSDSLLADCIREFSDNSAFQIAEIFAHRGEIDPAFDWLERARQQRDAGLNFIRVSPHLAELRKDGRWQGVIESLSD